MTSKEKQGRKSGKEQETNLAVLDGNPGASGQRVVGEQRDFNKDEGQAVAETKLRWEIRELLDRMGEDLFVLCQKLYMVYDGMLYTKWGFKTWKDYVEGEVQFKLRKAQYFVNIWSWFGNLPQEVRDKVKVLGWTKLKELVEVVNAANVDEWVAKATELNVPQLIEAVKVYRKKLLDSGPGHGEADPDEPKEQREAREREQEKQVVRTTFQLHGDQAEVVEAAIALASGMSNSDVRSNNLALVCQEFCATNSETAPSPEVYMRRVEIRTGMELLAIKMDKDGKPEVVYGFGLLDKIQKLVEEAAKEPKKAEG